MEINEIISTGLINILPILILLVPYFFIKKKTIANLYLRIYAGILIFYLIYWILPIIFQVGDIPKELELQPGEEGNILLGIGYVTSHFTSLVALFATYPFVTLPFIFFLSPFISLILVRNRLKKADGSIKDNLKMITYQNTGSPLKQIREALIKNKWSREKEILKLLVVLLPVSLYLLQVIIKLSGPENITLESSLGWFIEILFVYLATLIFSVELLFSSKITLKGQFIGENVRQQTFRSLYTVGAPISIISILLFIADNINNNTLDLLPIIFYFFAYFVMASVIFILFLRIFEPFSILILIKLIDWWKNKQNEERKKDSSNLTYVFLYGVVAIAIYFLYYFLIGGLLIQPYLMEDQVLASASFSFPSNPTLIDSIKFDLLNILGLVNVLISSLIVGLLLSRSLKHVKNIRRSLFIFLPIIIIVSLFVSGAPLNWFTGETAEYWLTGQTSFTNIFGYNFFILRSASYDAELIGITFALSLPYTYSRYIFTVLLWGLIIYYINRNFRSKNVEIDDETIEKIIFSDASEFPDFEDYRKGDATYLISLNEDSDRLEIKQEREEIVSLLKTLEKEQIIKEIKPEDEDEKRRFYFTLKYLFRNNVIRIWRPEYSFIFEPVEKQGLYIIYDDGRGVFDYAFQSDEIQDPSLVSGMFSAITSFVKEMTKSTEALKKIDHGDITILLEYGNKIFGALFIKGTQSSEVREPLKKFVQKFEDRYGEILKDWSGNLTAFKDEDNNKLVEDVFEEE
ncbi:MAG: hypothetical protein ACXAEX_05830 [Promethearchaeota archaeon]|jgi:hypothetical protein